MIAPVKSPLMNDVRRSLELFAAGSQQLLPSVEVTVLGPHPQSAAASLVSAIGSGHDGACSSVDGNPDTLPDFGVKPVCLASCSMI